MSAVINHGMWGRRYRSYRRQAACPGRVIQRSRVSQKLSEDIGERDFHHRFPDVGRKSGLLGNPRQLIHIPTRDQDGRLGKAALAQRGQQLRAVGPVQFEIDDKAVVPGGIQSGEQLRTSGKCIDVETASTQQDQKRPADGLTVIHDGDPVVSYDG